MIGIGRKRARAEMYALAMRIIINVSLFLH